MKITKKKGNYLLEFETKTDKEYFYNLLGLIRGLEGALGRCTNPQFKASRKAVKK